MEHLIDLRQQGPKSPGDMCRSGAAYVKIDENAIVYFINSKCLGSVPVERTSASAFIDTGIRNKPEHSMVARRIEDQELMSKVNQFIERSYGVSCRFD
jgi:hypothetical protein